VIDPDPLALNAVKVTLNDPVAGYAIELGFCAVLPVGEAEGPKYQFQEVG
jgi:hypothetical protein